MIIQNLSYEEFENNKSNKKLVRRKNITIIDSNLEPGIIAEVSGNEKRNQL